MRLAAIDRWTLGYTLFSASVLAARWPAHPIGAAWLGLAHALLVAVALGAPRARQAGPVGRFLGEFYPLILTSFVYGAIGTLHATAPRFYDDVVQGWEYRLFGAQPSREWIRAQPWPILSYPLHIAYLSYYFIVVAAALGPWLSGRRAAARRTILYVMAAFYLCYAIFLVFPVAGTRYSFPLAHNPATATGPAALTQRLLNAASSRGTAFPSSHVAAALVAAFCAWRGWRALGMVLVPLAIAMSVATVYGQFHYAVDALAGASLATLVLLAERRGGGHPASRLAIDMPPGSGSRP